MTDLFDALKDAPRLLMEARLKSIQGERFQPTGFADLGPARFQRHDGTEMLLVESAQSVANRMELACCKDDRRTLLDELEGLPHVVSTLDGERLTTSYLEAHRLSSPYLLNTEWAKKLANEMKLRDNFFLNDRAIHRTLFKYDPSCLLHGVWLSLKEYKDVFSGGRVRVARSLSGFIEAEDVRTAESGGTKFDRNSARTEEGANAETGYGTLPFHRTEFTAKTITAYFNLDLAQLRGYGLGDDAQTFLIALALFKIHRFLKTGLRLRTACDFDLAGNLEVKRPVASRFSLPDEVRFSLPDEVTLTASLKTALAECKKKNLFADPAVTTVKYEVKGKGAGELNLPKALTTHPPLPDELRDLVEQKTAGEGKKPKLSLVVKRPLNEAQTAALKAAYGQNDKLNKDIDKAVGSMKADGETQDEDRPDNGDGA